LEDIAGLFFSSLSLIAKDAFLGPSMHKNVFFFKGKFRDMWHLHFYSIKNRKKIGLLLNTGLHTQTAKSKKKMISQHDREGCRGVAKNLHMLNSLEKWSGSRQKHITSSRKSSVRMKTTLFFVLGHLDNVLH
jgi:hypothetical protein